MRPSNLNLRILPKRLPLAKCLIAVYVLLFLVFSSLLGLLVVPFPSVVPTNKFHYNNNFNGHDGGDCGSSSSSTRDIEWLMFNPNPVNEFTISVCVRLGGLAAVGGLESWFWTLHQYVLSSGSGNFRLHAVNLEALHWLEPSSDRFYYARAAVSRIVESGARLNIGPEEIIDECDVVLSSWVDPPLRPPPSTPSFKSILIIHGSDAIEREGTWLYGNQLYAYDAVVCVSAGCMDAYGPAFQKQNNNEVAGGQVSLHYIPSAIDLTKYDSNADMTHARNEFNLPVSKDQKILGFLGRIAEDKNPQLFVDVVSKLPKNWIGAMAGPLYLPEQMVSNLTSRIHLLGDVQEPWNFLAAVDALYVPSEAEGGPIVCLETWAVGKPFFMRRTGLAVDHEDGVFIVPDDARAEDISMFIDEKISSGAGGLKNSQEVQKKVAYGLKTVKEQFSTDVTRKKYHSLMSNLLENEENGSAIRLPFQVYYPKWRPPSQEAVQLTRRGRTLWARCFYKQCVLYVQINGIETGIETKASSRKVTIVARTFSMGKSDRGGGDDDGVAGYVRGEKGTEKLAIIEANSARQTIHMSLSANVFGLQLFDGHTIQLLDVTTAAEARVSE